MGASVFRRLRRLIFGAKLDPLSAETRHHIVLIAFLAWVGLGADGLSSACYGPEEAFLALGDNHALALFLAAATALTVFIISLGYNQVIELFPSGGGGYKAATQLIGPYAGLVSGASLLIDYVLTIAISVASAGDAVFSLLPANLQGQRFTSELVMAVLLIALNLRGMKESIKILLPIFLGFFLTHAALIVYGIAYHAPHLTQLLPSSINDAGALARNTGWIFVASLFLRAYSLGGGTYTGIEAVSNNVNILTEPRVRTGKLTMLYMATSLAFTAGGIILLYLLWHAAPEAGRTLNAVVFGQIIATLGIGNPTLSHALLAVVLALEGGLLLVAANTGFLGGPAVLANMAADRWVPRQFRQLSSRMVTRYGVLLMGGAAIAILLWSRGEVSVLVVLYSINVFLTFSLSLYGLTRHWWRQRRLARPWRARILLSFSGLLLTGFILGVTLIEKFTAGGWLTLVVTGGVIAICLRIKRHYDRSAAALARIDTAYAPRLDWDENAAGPELDPNAPTAAFFIGANRGAGRYLLDWVEKQLGERFHNYLFLSVGEVDKQAFDGERTLASLQARIDNSLHYFTSYCASRGRAARAYRAFGADPLDELKALAEQVTEDYPNVTFFANELVFGDDGPWTRLLHNRLPLAMQRHLNRSGAHMILIPIPIPDENRPAPARPADSRHIR